MQSSRSSRRTPALPISTLSPAVEAAKRCAADFVVVAPDDPLVLGMVDAMEAEGFPCFGPRKNAAVIEGSKAFAKDLMKKYSIPTVVSMNPLMVDGTGMCGGCRLSVGGETKFACVDGPEFDGHKVDFDEAMARGAMYKDFERHAYEDACNLFRQEVQ